jgi:hypothetical protein
VPLRKLRLRTGIGHVDAIRERLQDPCIVIRNLLGESVSIGFSLYSSRGLPLTHHGKVRKIKGLRRLNRGKKSLERAINSSIFGYFFTESAAWGASGVVCGTFTTLWRNRSRARKAPIVWPFLGAIELRRDAGIELCRGATRRWQAGG